MYRQNFADMCIHKYQTIAATDSRRSSRISRSSSFRIKRNTPRTCTVAMSLFHAAIFTSVCMYVTTGGAKHHIRTKHYRKTIAAKSKNNLASGYVSVASYIANC